MRRFWIDWKTEGIALVEATCASAGEDKVYRALGAALGAVPGLLDVRLNAVFRRGEEQENEKGGEK